MSKVLLAFLFMPLYLSAQVIDNFSDGDFINNPVWAGDNSEFTINTSFQLQLNNTIAGASYLSTPISNTSLNNMEWPFYIKLIFYPSRYNYVSV